jgi:hypothetical protein
LKKTRKKKEPEPIICEVHSLPDEDPYYDDWRTIHFGEEHP